MSLIFYLFRCVDSCYCSACSEVATCRAVFAADTLLQLANFKTRVCFLLLSVWIWIMCALDVTDDWNLREA